jgi:hypothetical protein
MFVWQLNLLAWLRICKIRVSMDSSVYERLYDSYREFSLRGFNAQIDILNKALTPSKQSMSRIVA